MLIDYGKLKILLKKAFQFKVTKNAAYKYSTASDAENLEIIWTNKNGKGVIYTKHDAESEWVRTEQEDHQLQL